MIEDGPSLTALQVAAARAAHILFDPAPHLLDDRIALDLLGPEYASMVDGYRDEGSWMLLENRVSIPLRARYVEDRLASAYATGMRQLVILGAGLDSFAFRQPPDLTDLRVFEIDHPNMQSWKRGRLRSLGWSLPNNTFFVPCDFERVDTTEALRDSEFDPSEPAFISWMGVTYYLNKTTVEASLTHLAKFLAPGSQITLDLMRPWEELPSRYEEIRTALVEYLKGAQEPQINRYRPKEMTHTLSVAGFKTSQIERPEDIEREYRPKIGTKLPFSERFRFVLAST
jgi:methyltransferase (TIGR00027 family)